MQNPTWIVRQRIRSKYGLEYTYCSGTICSLFLDLSALLLHLSLLLALYPILTMSLPSQTAA